ncbi:MAG: D-alanyl-D-alanine carboxypeptidase/D-alanyl-D-alanine-endopeptidase [Bacteroidaceae bacterium]|nr:D-alanyl-D-alanine carboxypeptidase/D-alanyl-D-alanine-endopeptidase [Bacteroidaceae bacterium]
MKYTRFLFLLLLLASCASQRAVRHRTYQADALPAQPVAVEQPVQTVEEEELATEEPVVSARPLVSQVRPFPEGTWQADKQQALERLCQSPLFESSQLGLYVYDLTDGQPLYAVNAAHRMRPASCQKVVTAITALDCLGGDYQLRTEFRTKGKVAGGTLQGDLIVVGGMDPMVTPDELLEAAQNLRQKQGIESIAGSIVYDLSMREDKPLGWGWCWDDDYGPLSALLVDGKDTFEQNWLQALARAGIKVNSGARGKEQGAREQSKTVYSIRHSIDELLEPMMKNSNNIYAECLFYQTAALGGKKGAGHKEAAQRTEKLLSKIGVDPSPYRIADGSGLSLYNYVSAEMLVALLGYAWQNTSIKEHLLPSLPIAGFDGTLKNRMTGTEADGNVKAKTGSVTGISSLAGYITAANGHTLAFAIINQGISTMQAGRAFQDKVCQELCR